MKRHAGTIKNFLKLSGSSLLYTFWRNPLSVLGIMMKNILFISVDRVL
jgi:hypothetical protein